MDNKILHMEHFKKDRFYRIDYLKLNFWQVIQFALVRFDEKPFDPDEGRAPDTWNPILFCRGAGQFDPNMMDGSEARHCGGTPWTPWPEINGYERTKLFIEENYAKITLPSWYKQVPIPIPKSGYTGKITIMHNHFLYTKEVISDNEIILSICNKATMKYKRVHIKDLKAVIDIMFIRNELGNLTYKKFDTTKLKTIISDGSHIKIQDPSIKEILTKLKFLDAQIYEFTSA